MTIRLEKWSLVLIDPFKDEPGHFITPPEDCLVCLHGIAFEDPRRPDGTSITTSELVGYVDGMFITRSGSKYVLGEVDPEYEKQYPGAMSRVIERGRKIAERSPNGAGRGTA